MRPLRYSINVTLDGCIDHMAGTPPDEELHMRATATVARADAVIFGRITYGLMEGGWRKIAETGVRPDGMPEWMVPFATTIGPKKKYIVSDSAETADWNTEIIRSDALEATVRALKNQPGEGLLCGGAAVPLALAELGLIDEYEFVIHPRIAGRGPALFAGLSKPLDLRLVDRLEYASGAVAMRYVVKG